MTTTELKRLPKGESVQIVYDTDMYWRKQHGAESISKQEWARLFYKVDLASLTS